MIFITGDTRSKQFVAQLQSYGWGRMVIDRRIVPWSGEPWAFDNGAYRDYLKNQEFSLPAFVRRVEMAKTIGKPLFSVVPDKVCCGRASLEYSNLHIDLLPDDWPRYLAVQNGMIIKEVEASIIEYGYDGIFLGGDDIFKRHTDQQWSQLAKALGKKFHYGRCGTRKKIIRAYGVGADSCDSAFPL
jgi:hypothetical protein